MAGRCHANILAAAVSRATGRAGWECFIDDFMAAGPFPPAPHFHCAMPLGSLMAVTCHDARLGNANGALVFYAGALCAIAVSMMPCQISFR